MKEKQTHCLLISGKDNPTSEIEQLLNQKDWYLTQKTITNDHQVKETISKEKPDLLFLTEDILTDSIMKHIFSNNQPMQPTYILANSIDPIAMANAFKAGSTDYIILPQKKSAFTKRIQETQSNWQTKYNDENQIKQDIDLIWNTIPVLISYMNRDHNFVEVNQTFLDVTGKKRKDVIGKSCFEVLPTQAAGYLKDDIEVMMMGKPKYNIIETINTDRGIQWIKTNKIPWKDKDNKICGIISYSFDITDVKSAQEAFKKSDEMLRQVLNTNPNPIFVKDKNGKYILVNQAMATLYGITTEQMIGQSELDLAKSLPKMDYETILKRSQEDAQTMKERRTKHEREEKFILEDNSVRWIHTTTVPLPLGHGQLCLLGVSVDLTDRKNSEILMEKQAKELSFSNAELKQFAYVAAHDLQEPLRMVASYVQLLARRYSEQLDEEANEFIDFAVEGAVRIHNLINDLLAYSQLNSHENSYTETDCNTILKHILQKNNSLIEETKAQVHFQNLPTIYADSRLLENLFENLVDNAIKFRNGEPPEIKVTSKSDDQAWIFSVQDNGIGFDMQFIDKIFSIFQKLRPKAVSPGTGIGLSICKKIVDSHGGKIWAESSPGNGATFHFSIPHQKATNNEMTGIEK